VTRQITELAVRIATLTPLLRELAPEADRLARLPDAIVRELVALGAFRLWIPTSCGGLESSLPEALRIYEAAGRADGSVGWAVMIGAGGGLFADCLELETARAIFAPAEALIAGSGAAEGSAEQVEGGYRATGRWRYASGAHHATTFTANCIVTCEGRPVRGVDAEVLIRAMAFTPAQVTIHECWDASGMRGTGSHDFEVRDAFVPQQRSFTVPAEAPREPGALYRLPFGVLTELPVTAVAVGIARHALEAFALLATRKKAAGASSLLAGDPFLQARYAQCHGCWCRVRDALQADACAAWEAAVAGRACGPHLRARITSNCVSGVAELVAAVGDLAHLAGMTAVLQAGELARAWRDLQTLAAHASVSQRQLAAAGQALIAGYSENV
jgi:alkylation response protein AidB-like acyl-CoA dehydrogenase